MVRPPIWPTPRAPETTAPDGWPSFVEALAGARLDALENVIPALDTQPGQILARVKEGEAVPFYAAWAESLLRAPTEAAETTR